MPALVAKYKPQVVKKFLELAKIIRKKTKILSNVHLIGNYYRLTLDTPQIVRVALPGQFVMLRISNGYQPLLRRPFSIHRVGYNSKNPTSNIIEILYEVVGKGTEILSNRKAGECLDVVGPLGNGFDLSAIRYPLSAILVGGGIGVAPLFFLAQRLTERKTHNARRTTLVLIGAKTKEEILSQKEFANLGCCVRISTDDGSAGFKGKVSELLKYLLRTTNYELSTIYACGPKPMLKEIAIISKRYNIPTQISLGEYMACGLGVCLGCMIETKGGQKFICRDGPVFDASEIKGYDK
jgi:dihydroorotate dehydrogenase electron transfer subunit